MATYNRPTTVVMYTDTRGEYLQAAVNKVNTTGCNIVVINLGEVTLEQMCSSAAIHLDTHPCDIIYFLGGAFNVLTKHEIPKFGSTKTLDWATSAELVVHMDRVTIRELGNLKGRHPNSKLVMCTLPAFQLNRVCTNATPMRQQLVDSAIWDVNQNIYQLNRFNDVSTPWIARFTHKYHKRKGRDNDYKSLEDGFVPSSTTTSRWASLLINHLETLKIKLKL